MSPSLLNPPRSTLSDFLELRVPASQRMNVHFEVVIWTLDTIAFAALFEENTKVYPCETKRKEGKNNEFSGLLGKELSFL
jgi:hypothetical protein